MATAQFAGPVDYAAFAFDEHADLGAGLASVLERARAGLIEILDIELIAVSPDGRPQKRAFSDLDGVTGLDVTVFDGVESGILDADDLTYIAAELRPGQVAIVIVYEDRSLAAAADAWAAVGGVELFSGGVDLDALAQSLEEAERS